MNTEKLTELLTSAGGSHHIYEQTALKGEYDQEWAQWYANYLVLNNISSLLPQPVTAEQLATLLTGISARYQESDQSQSWAEFTANKLLA